MGLKLRKPIDNVGINGDYWRIQDFRSIDFISNSCTSTAMMRQYISQELRQQDKNPIGSEQIELDDEFWSQMVGDVMLKDLLRSMAYAWKKRSILDENGNETNEWATAVDC